MLFFCNSIHKNATSPNPQITIISGWQSANFLLKALLLWHVIGYNSKTNQTKSRYLSIYCYMNTLKSPHHREYMLLKMATCRKKTPGKFWLQLWWYWDIKVVAFQAIFKTKSKLNDIWRSYFILLFCNKVSHCFCSHCEAGCTGVNKTMPFCQACCEWQCLFYHTLLLSKRFIHLWPPFHFPTYHRIQRKSLKAENIQDTLL